MAIFPKLTASPLCLGCRSCFDLGELRCTTCNANGQPVRGRADVVTELGEVFLCAHRLPDCVVLGGTDVPPYRCPACEGSPLAHVGGQGEGTGHSIDCVNFWNRRAAMRQTKQDGALLRATELGT